MSQRTRTHSLIYPASQAALLLMVALLFVPGALKIAFWGLGAAPVLLGVGLFLRQRKSSAEISRTPGSGPMPETGTGWLTPQVRSLQGALRRIDRFQFEKLVAAIYELQGSTVQRHGSAKPDGAVDLLIEKEGVRTVVQCRHWKHAAIREKDLREFLGTLTDAGISNGIFVTLRRYTKFAETFAHKHRIALVGEAGLTSMLEEANWKQNRRILEFLDDK